MLDKKRFFDLSPYLTVNRSTKYKNRLFANSATVTMNLQRDNNTCHGNEGVKHSRSSEQGM